ncbi:MAG TPA: AmmeMemoRadiSam system protein B [Ignavibacteriaceae bacterium]|nr:AmmeMemoRadiSam system protein B [Ignavibacteriaceae bacterium]
MKTKLNKLYLIILSLLNFSILYSQEVRPVRDEVGFCWEGDKFDSFIKWLDENCGQDNFKSENLIAAISPHDDYLYAGKVYYPLYKLIHTKEVVIFGVTHGAVRKEINDPKNILILDEFKKWKGLYKDVEVSPLREIIKRKLDKQYYMVSNKAQTLEHSIEALIPFLQHYNRDIIITPIMVTAMPFGRMDSLSSELAGIISGYEKDNNLKPGKDIFFLISNDANHYGEDFDNQPYGLDENGHEKATANDKRIADETFNGAVSNEKIKSFSGLLWPEAGVSKDCPLWCGRYPIVFGLLTIEKIMNEQGKKLNGKVFKYSDSWTAGVLPFKGSKMGITAPYSLKHWVGWLSAGFYAQ